MIRFNDLKNHLFVYICNIISFSAATFSERSPYLFKFLEIEINVENTIELTSTEKLELINTTITPSPAQVICEALKLKFSTISLL